MPRAGAEADVSLEREMERWVRLAERLLRPPALALSGPGSWLAELDPCARMDRMISALLPDGAAAPDGAQEGAAPAPGEDPTAASAPARSAGSWSPESRPPGWQA